MNSKWPFHLSPIEINEVLNYVEEGYGERTIARELGLRRTQVDKAIRAWERRSARQFMRGNIPIKT